MNEAKKVGIVVRSGDPESCHTALRCALYHLFDKNDVKVFIITSEPSKRDITKRFVELFEQIECLGGLVIFCCDVWHLESNLKDYFLPFLSNEEITGIVGSKIFHRVMTEEVEMREFV